MNLIFIINFLLKFLGLFRIECFPANNITHLMFQHFELQMIHMWWCDGENLVCNRIRKFSTSTKDFSHKNTNHIWRIFSLVTTKKFTKVIRTINNSVRGTIRKWIVWVWKLSLNWAQLVDLYHQFISLHSAYKTYKLTVYSKFIHKWSCWTE